MVDDAERNYHCQWKNLCIVEWTTGRRDNKRRLGESAPIFMQAKAVSSSQGIRRRANHLCEEQSDNASNRDTCADIE